MAKFYNRMEPISDQIVIKQDDKNKKIKINTCPRCGNQINQYNSKYKCPFCFQKLKWPGVKYDIDDEWVSKEDFIEEKSNEGDHKTKKQKFERIVRDQTLDSKLQKNESSEKR